ncbi:MAG: PIN domain-containing protein [Firmicutes bacterium]|jgi:predicted nucleic-acid-binding protein|nr:PIN domain-containing protein [Bacillota bacterium]NBI62498.1 PIN domain-containing protein [Clostridiales bacterium]
MKNMVVLIDTNILLNYITSRGDKYLNESIKIVELCALGKLNGYIAFHTLSTLWYVLRKKSDKERRDNLRDICTIFSVASAPQTEIMDAIEKDSFADFEDCLQDKCAKEVGADYIITVNEKDFADSEINAINPSEFLGKIK